MPKPKITIIGAGNVGATTAHLTALKGLGDIVLIDVREGVAKGKALDIMHSGPIEGFEISIIGTRNYEDTKDSDLIIITSGVARNPGMSREDLLAANAKIVREVAEKAAKNSPNSAMIVVTNPVEAMAYIALKASNFPRHKVIGMSGVLDSSRFSSLIAKELNVSPKEVKTVAIGCHSDLMVFPSGFLTAKSTPLAKLLPKEKITGLMGRARNSGKEIVELLKLGSAFYAPASSAALMAEAILHDKKISLPCSAYCDKEYNAGGCFIGVPAILGKNVVEKIIELSLAEEEKEAFEKCIEYVKAISAKAEEYL